MSLTTLLKPIVITPGCPAGIGPDIVIMLAQHRLLNNVILIADRDLLIQRANQLNCAIDWQHVTIEHIPLSAPCTPGIGLPEHSPYVLACLERAVDGCLNKRFHGMVTGPVNKALINRSGTPFQGHTEWIAHRCHTPQVVMMLTTQHCRVALVTTHIPLRNVPDAITQVALENCITLVAKELQHKFGVANPRITVTGLNPHAGENGYIGREEIDVIIPTLEKLRQQGLNLTGPVAADTLFQAETLADIDCVVAMYHDQGLTPLKTLGFGETVNVTLGLPIIRTSVDHGTAYALAGSGKAHPGSLLAALQLARSLHL